jgi:quercetin dioxygenase-like cupin family protein
MTSPLYSCINFFDESTTDAAGHIVQGARRAPQGMSVYLSSLKGYRFTALFEFLPDHPRGNHAHSKRVECLYVIEGELKAFFWSGDAPLSVTTKVLKKGDWLTIYPGTFHRYEAVCRTLLLEVSEEAYDASDTIKASA